jgi:hypothetical protein
MRTTWISPSAAATTTHPKPGAMFNTLITEGRQLGMHLHHHLDTYNNVSRCLSRKALTEFEMRVVFQMSANDSASLIDSAKASRPRPPSRPALQRATRPPRNLPPLRPTHPSLDRSSHKSTSLIRPTPA